MNDKASVNLHSVSMHNEAWLHLVLAQALGYTRPTRKASVINCNMIDAVVPIVWYHTDAYVAKYAADPPSKSAFTIHISSPNTDWTATKMVMRKRMAVLKMKKNRLARAWLLSARSSAWIVLTYKTSSTPVAHRSAISTLNTTNSQTTGRVRREAERE